ncbi:LysR family transcriptional regulator substrate-binding protein [Neobacillus cucumis]|uniref:LysR family transcriptional regulator substrate-binding protein n=1 Tax=Neobacillus cucumis TaxID=1740721 RepID=UPI00203CEF7C|nr:LysR family transcriptional regulator substrate-binding protein [Neobacillus cucumis]MCM3730001.1 LysR family transcriptional regulator substrate-binding protein [Neobacillus cucumis]
MSNWIKEGSVDFGFVNTNSLSNLTTISLQKDEMVAVLPANQPLAAYTNVSFEDLKNGPYILLGEGVGK